MVQHDYVIISIFNGIIFANVDIWYDPDDLAATGETSGPGFFHLARVSFKDEFL